MSIRFRCADGDVAIPSGGFASLFDLVRHSAPNDIRVNNTTMDELCGALRYVDNAIHDAIGTCVPSESIVAILDTLGFDSMAPMTDFEAEYIADYATYYAYRNRVSHVAYMINRSPRASYSSLAAAAAIGGAIDVLKYLVEIGHIFCCHELVACAKSGNVLAFEYMLEHRKDRELCPSIGYAASFKGHIDILRIYHDNGGGIDECMMEDAAEHGHTSMMKYLIRHGIAVDHNTYIRAIANGHDRMLRFLIASRAVPLCKRMMKCALQCNNYRAIQRLIIAGCPMGKKVGSIITQSAEL